MWRVRWRQGGRNRSKVLGRKRDAEAFDAELVRPKRTGELAQLDAGKESLADFGEEWWRLYAEPNLACSTLQVYAVQWDAHIPTRCSTSPPATATHASSSSTTARAASTRSTTSSCATRRSSPSGGVGGWGRSCRETTMMGDGRHGVIRGVVVLFLRGAGCRELGARIAGRGHTRLGRGRGCISRRPTRSVPRVRSEPPATVDASDAPGTSGRPARARRKLPPRT